MQGRNADLPEERAVRLRIGINLGGARVRTSSVTEVNVAARLEGLAPANSVMASGTVRDHLDNRLDLQFEDMGEKALKEGFVLRISGAG